MGQAAQSAWYTTTGTWLYTLDNSKPATQALSTGQQVTDTLRVTSQDGTASQTITVTVNGVLQNTISQSKPATGRVGFQLEGVPFELRAVRLTPL